MQIKFAFDKTTLIKIAKGALYAISGGAAIAFLEYVGALQIDNPVWAPLIAWFVPSAINAVKEWMKGE